MDRLVLKFGGTSMADIDRIRRAARHARHEAEQGHAVAVIVSAQAGETNRLVELAQTVLEGADHVAPDEYDVVVASGEQVSAGLLALALRAEGCKARSWTGMQAGFKASRAHARARIEAVEAGRLGEAIDTGEIAVVTGFQGFTEDGRIATLGRGGSDTSAVALAAALNAARCDIYTDVDGVYTTDPRIEEKARRIDRISYEEMLELASLGAKVLQTRSVELAMARKVPLRVLSSFIEPGAPNPGTLVCEEDEIMEKQLVSGIAYMRDEARVSLLGVPDRPGAAGDVFAALAAADVNVDMIVQSRSSGAKPVANISFSVSQKDLQRALDAVEVERERLGYERIETRTGLSKVSVAGVGMKSHAGVAHTMFSALGSESISIDAITTSEIKISVLIPEDATEKAVKVLHAAYELDGG
ncbi:MAG: aspartate kinase [Maricaulaceae bacterium]|jgi:aspartate kinase